MYRIFVCCVSVENLELEKRMAATSQNYAYDNEEEATSWH